MVEIQKELDPALRDGDYFRAYDLASAALKTDPDNLDLHYVVLLALARTGANRQARARMSALLDHTKPAKQMPTRLAEDFAAMDARLCKNLALEESGEKRRTLAAESARRYEAAHAIKGGHFPAINAATMWCLAGNREKSRTMAHIALEEAENATEEYWPLASSAEAHLLLGQMPEVRSALAAAMACAEGNVADKAVTRRQLALVCDQLAISWPSIDIAPSSIILNFCGDDIGEISASDNSSLGGQIDRLISSQSTALAFGAIRNSVELLITERLLAHGIDVQLILPLHTGVLAEAIGCNHDAMLRRLESCIEKLHSPALTMGAGEQVNSALLALSGRCAMGLAMMRADNLMMEAKQLAIRDAGKTAYADVTRLMETWSRRGLSQIVLDAPSTKSVAMPNVSTSRYETKALLFCDIKGFSKISEQGMSAFVELVLGGLAAEINKFRAEVEYKETAGDGVYIVFRGAVAAADCALALAACIDRLPPGPLSSLGIRISAHVGAVFPAIDPITGLRKFFGSEVIRAARIEPITPVGECYVTEQFASILALEAPERFNCDYAGVLESAKGYGAFRMYSLRQRKTSDWGQRG
jgi:class 3 adenylate cyclase